MLGNIFLPPADGYGRAQTRGRVTKKTIEPVRGAGSASQCSQLGFEGYRIFVPMSRVRMLIPCLDLNKILLPNRQLIKVWGIVQDNNLSSVRYPGQSKTRYTYY